MGRFYGLLLQATQGALSDWNVMDIPYKESRLSKMHVTCRSLFSSIILVLSLAIPSRDVNIASFTLAALWNCSRVSSISLCQSWWEMASSFVVSRNSGTLSHLFLGLQNSQHARLCSLRSFSGTYQPRACKPCALRHPMHLWQCPHPPWHPPGWSRTIHTLESPVECPTRRGGAQRQACQCSTL